MNHHHSKPINHDERFRACPTQPLKWIDRPGRITSPHAWARLFLLGAALCSTSVAHAASIAWDSPQNITGPADVDTAGTYYGSWAPSVDQGNVPSINGVKFKGNDLELTMTGMAGAGAAFGTHTTSDANYNALLQYATWSNDGNASFTINGTGCRPLTPGRKYLIQFWVSDTRSYGKTRNETVGGSGALSYQTASGMGQWVIGRFTADAATQTVTLSANASAQINLVQVRDITPQESMTRHERFKTLKYGIFSHYTWWGYAGGGTPNIYGQAPNSADEVANNFDAEKYADDCYKAGAQYVVFTAWHSNTHPLWPSKAMAKWVGGGACPTKRDVISDMIDACKAKGLRVFLYTHPFQPIARGSLQTYAMLDLYDEVVDRYGPRIDGLWVDENQTETNQDSCVDYSLLLATIRGHNLDLVTMQNNGGTQIYTCDMGIPEGLARVNSGESLPLYNMLSGYPGVTSENMLTSLVYQAAANYEGGGIHFSIDGVGLGGLSETSRVFTTGSYLAPIRASVCDTHPSTSFPPVFNGRNVTVPNGWLATESNDGTKVYIHVLTPPSGSVLNLPATADGKRFSGAKLMASLAVGGSQQYLGTAMTFAQSSRGIQVTLPTGTSWSSLDTVIELSVVSQGGAGLVNDTSSSISYSGNSWYAQGNRNVGEYNNDIHAATANGDSFTFTFNGTDVDYIVTRASNRGAVDIYIDNVYQTTVDASSGSPTGSRQVLYSKSGLARGQHTLKGVKKGGTYMDVDCFKVTELINDSDLSFPSTMSGSYSTGGPNNWWQPGYNGVGTITPAVAYYPGKEPLNAPLSNEPNSDWFETTFTGTGVQIPLSSAFSSAYFYIKVDGVFYSNVQVWAGQVSNLTITGLSNSSHTVRGITWRASTDQAQPGLNGITVTRPGLWNSQSGRGYGEYGDDVHYTDVKGVSFSYNFTGSGVEMICTRDADARTTSYWLSGGGSYIGTPRNNYSANRIARSSVFSMPNIVPGNYTISAANAANSTGIGFDHVRLAVDAIRVYKAEKIAGGMSWGSSGAGGSGTWDIGTTANWNESGAATAWYDFGGVDYVATFGGSAGAVSLASNVNVNKLQFNTSGYTLQGSTIILNGNQPQIQVADGATATIFSYLSYGTSGFTKSGGGNLQLATGNDNVGSIAISGGSISMTGDRHNNYWAVGSTYVGSGCKLSNYTHSHIKDLTLAGGELASTGVDGFWGGWMLDRDIVVNGNATSTISAQRVSVANGSNAARAFNVESGSVLNVTGNLQDAPTTSANGLNKTGAGSMKLQGTNTYTGSTTVSAGKLVVSGNLTSTSSVTIASGATLEISGTLIVAGDITINGTLILVGTPKLRVGGKIINNGTITNNSQNAYTYVVGNSAGSFTGYWQPGYNGACWITPNTAYNPDNAPLSGTLPAGGDSFTFSFYGTGAQIALTSAYASGYFYIMIDGVYKTNFKVTAGVVQAYSTGTLALGHHTIKAIVWKNTTDPFQPGVNGFAVTLPANMGSSSQSIMSTQMVMSTALDSPSPIVLPAPRLTADIGAVGRTGSATYDAGTYSLSGAGTGLTAASDALHYVYQAASGDCDVRVRVQGLNKTTARAKAGVMIRETLAANARCAGVYVTPGNGVQFLWRSSAGSMVSLASKAGLKPPYWTRLKRTGNSFAAYYSANGKTWTKLGKTMTIPMATSALIGTAVTSGKPTALTTGTLTHETVIP